MCRLVYLKGRCNIPSSHTIFYFFLNLHFNTADFALKWCGAHSEREHGLSILFFLKGCFHMTAVLATTSKVLFQFNQNKLAFHFSCDVWNQESWLKCLTSQESIWLSAISPVIQVTNQASWLPLKLHFKLQPSGNAVLFHHLWDNSAWRKIRQAWRSWRWRCVPPC